MATLSPSQLVMEPTLPSILAQHWSADPHSTSPLSSPKSLVRKLEQGISKITIPIVSSHAFISRPPLKLLSTACNTSVNVTISFGGKRSWTISPVDFQLTKLTKDTCLGAFFELQSGSSAPSWIVGDTFLVRFTFTELRGIGLISIVLTSTEKCLLRLPLFSSFYWLCRSFKYRHSSERSRQATTQCYYRIGGSNSISYFALFDKEQRRPESTHDHGP